MQEGAQWDLMVAHGLGIDHAGHTFNVGSAQMLAKLRETDDRIKQVRLPACIGGRLAAICAGFTTSRYHRRGFVPQLRNRWGSSRGGFPATGNLTIALLFVGVFDF